MASMLYFFLATTTTGETIRRAMECINYYGGMVTCIASIFSTIDEVNGVKIDKLFDDDDVVNYQTYPVTECPFCKKGLPIELWSMALDILSCN